MIDLRLRAAYDFRIWVEAPYEICLKRGLERDGPDALPLWEAWAEKERRYWEEQRPRDFADAVLDGSGG